MGGAETAARQLAEHLRAQTELAGRGPHDVRARPAHLGRRARAGDQRGQRGAGAPPRVGARPAPGLLRPRRAAPADAPHGHAGAGGRWVDYNGPVSPELVDAVVASDADVVAFYPYLYHPTVATIGKVRVPAVLHPAAHDEPALYLPCSVARSATPTPSASIPRPNASSSSGCTRWRSVRRSCSGSAWASPRGARAGRGATCWAWGTAPTWSAWGASTSTRAPRCSRRTSPPTRSGTPGRWPWPSSGPVSFELEPHPDIVVTGAVDEADKWDIVQDALVAVSPSALESFSLVVVEAGSTGCRSWSTAPAGRPASTASARAGDCGSRPTPNSRRCSTAWSPTPRCVPRSGRAGGTTWTGTSSGPC